MEVTFNERLEEILRKKNLKKIDVARKLDINKECFANWRKNPEQLPHVLIAIKLADFLDVSVEYLITGIEPKKIQVENALNEKIKTLSDKQKEFLKVFIDSFIYFGLDPESAHIGELYQDMPEKKKIMIKDLMEDISKVARI